MNVLATFHQCYCCGRSGETVRMENTAVRVDGTRSTVDYTPRSELDYGNLLCWGENSIGVQVRIAVSHQL